MRSVATGYGVLYRKARGPRADLQAQDIIAHSNIGPFHICR
jgi:hypothetical protein